MSKFGFVIAASVLSLVAAELAAQTEIYVPDNMPAVGTCNAAPFGAASMTYISRIPASFLNPAQPVVDDLSFTPCNSNTLSFPTLQLGIGHVPNPLPLPFQFPTFDASGNLVSLGSFLDYTPVWNSVAQGALSWPHTANTWSPMGFAASGGTGFTWNGTQDIAYYVTFQGATGFGSFHRTSTEPFRAYQSGVYQAVSSVTTGASGAKVRLTVRAGVTITLNAPFVLGGTGAIDLSSPADANGTYLCGYSFGTAPGIPLADLRIIPLNYDFLLDLSLTPNNGIFFNNIGLLSATGTATPTTAVPNYLPLLGLTLYAAFVVADGTNPTGVGTISPALPIIIQ